MKVGEKRNINFKGILNNKALLKTLEFAGEKAPIVSAGTTLVLASVVRPIAILNSKAKDKKDKAYASARSVASGALGFVLTSTIFNSINKAIKNVENKPDEYLSQSTLKVLKNGTGDLLNSSNYKTIKQTTKLISEFLAVIPKAIITTALITPMFKILFEKKIEKEEERDKNITFKGKLEKIYSNILESRQAQEFGEKFKNKNFVQHVLSLKDVFASCVFGLCTKANKSIEKKVQNTLITETFISTAATILGGYAVDKITQKPLQNLKEKFIKANTDDPKLAKYLDGAKVIKPILILGGLYYVIIPMLSVMWAEKIAGGKHEK
ncbi:hypothetical protein IKA92_06620 [bacterium]|nr:hypothetical protein [bacterium]